MAISLRRWTAPMAGPPLAFLAALLFGAMAAVSYAQQGATSPPPSDRQSNDLEDILKLDIDQLGKVDVSTPAMNVEVTSVAKQESTVGRSAAAIYVITSEMIARSPATNIPDLLRMAPGVEVARIDTHTWAIAVRGFNNRYTDKLLVLIDGRTVYTPITTGVYWDVQDVMLQDLERIEVIRGPGGTIWGANAVNGVINIITKKAKKTQGALVTYGGGADEDLALGGARVGKSNGNGLYYRIYGKHFERAPGYSPDGEAHDDWRQGRAGFRADWEPDRDGSRMLTVQGDYYVGREGVYGAIPLPVSPYQQTLVENEEVNGGNLLARWTKVFDDSSDWSVQLYYDQAQREFSAYKQYVNTFDVEFQHRFPLQFQRRHEFIWGGDYRQIHDDEVGNGFADYFDPTQRTTSLFSMFFQDEIALVEDKLFFTVGSKFEHNDYSGFEFQPSGRLLYAPDKKRAIWAAISRAVRTPCRADQDVRFTLLPQPTPSDPNRYFPRLTGSRDFQSEQLMAYELGYRAQPKKEFAYDIALFYNVYESVPTFLEGAPYVDPYGNVIVPLVFSNLGRGRTYGAEITGEWTLSDRWRLSGSYGYLYVQATSVPGTEPFISPGSSPRNQVKVASKWDLGGDWQFDMNLRYVDNLPALNVPNYITMDLRLAWRPRENLEYAVIGRNLFDGHHLEFAEATPFFFCGTEVRRSVYGSVTWRY
ncbi:MAG: TonB-dependent receptor [Pirellulales bacterium]|nr:TonB-dependent receptor [Pirellulales bacterium]